MGINNDGEDEGNCCLYCCACLLLTMNNVEHDDSKSIH